MSNNKITILYKCDDIIIPWVSEKIGGPDFGPCSTMGIIKGNSIIAGIVFHNYIVSPLGVPIMCELSMAAIDPRWCLRYTINKILSFAFFDLKVGRIQTTTPVESKEVIKFNEKIGFKFEGIGRKAHFLGGDVVVMSMLRDECKWIKE